MTSTTIVRPPFDPQIATALRDRPDDVLSTMGPADIDAVRARAVRPSDEELTAGGTYELSEHRAAGGADHEVPLVLLRPAGRAGQALPVVVHLHGGGLISGDEYSDVPAIVALAATVSGAVVSVGYRLAPEHPYPAAVEDAYAALRWVAEEGPRLGLDPRRIVVGGVSAGAGLAAALMLLLRERGGPAVLGQMLVCPMLDDRNDTPSGWQMAGTGSWDRAANAVAWAAYLPGVAGGSAVPETASAARALDLGGLPPMYIDVGSAETFRDECVDYAARVWACGGDAELHVWPGGCHAFDFLEPTAAVSLDAREARARWLGRVLSRTVDVDMAAASAAGVAPTVSSSEGILL